MDITALTAELQSADPDLPPEEAAFIEAVEAAQTERAAGEISQDEYYERVATASDRYRHTMDSEFSVPP